MRTAAVLGADIHADSGDPSATPAAYNAVITAVGGDTVSIIVAGYSERHDFAGLAFLAPGGTPSVGDEAFAVFTDSRDPLVLVPGTATAGGGGGGGEVSFATLTKFGVF